MDHTHPSVPTLTLFFNLYPDIAESHWHLSEQNQKKNPSFNLIYRDTEFDYKKIL